MATLKLSAITVATFHSFVTDGALYKSLVRRLLLMGVPMDAGHFFTDTSHAGGTVKEVLSTSCPANSTAVAVESILARVVIKENTLLAEVGTEDYVAVGV